MSVKTIVPKRHRQRFGVYMSRYWPLYAMLLLPTAFCLLFKYWPMTGLVMAFKNFKMMRGIWGSDFLAAQWSKKHYTGWCIYRFKDRTHDVAGYMNYLWDIEQAFLEKNVIQGAARTVDAMVDDPSLPSWGTVTLDSIYKQ